MRPLIVGSPESMVKLRVITARDYAEPALKALHKIGLLHVETAEELKPVDRDAIESGRREVSELLSFVENVLSYIPGRERVPLGEGVEVIYTRPFSEIGAEVRSLYGKVSELYDKSVTLNDEAQQLAETRKYLEPLSRRAALALKDLDFSGDFVFSRVFIVPAQSYDTLHNQIKGYQLGGLAVGVDNEMVSYIIARARDRKVVESIADDAGARALRVPDEALGLREYIRVIDGKIGHIGEEIARLQQEIQGRAGEEMSKLVLLREALAAESERLAVLEKASEAKYVNLIEGWLPASETEFAIAEIRDKIDYVFMDTRKPGPKEEPPTRMRNARGLKPFEVIVNLFGTPKYREWDPTPVVAYSFAFFFGLMICDVVYAVGIILFTRFFLARLVDDSDTEGYRLFQRILYISSVVALITGLLSGNYLGDIYNMFGFESLALVAGVQEVLQNPVAFIALAIVIGLIHINVAHLLAMVKGLKERQAGVVLGKIGLFVIQIFGVPIILDVVLGVSIPLLHGPAGAILLPGTLAGVVLVIVGAILESRGMGMILWIFNITGVLGDVMSYCRLAGVGLATFYLAASFNMLADIFRTMLPGVFGLIIGTILAIGVLLVGHVINLLMSTITGFIHSLRLCFVEFLFKFYEGGGRLYRPFRLKTRSSVVVGEKV